MQLSNAMNTMVNQALTDAMGALIKLDDAGATVTKVEVTGRNPIFWLDSDGPRGIDAPRVVKSVVDVETTGRRCRARLMVMKLGTVQVQWFVESPIAVGVAS